MSKFTDMHDSFSNSIVPKLEEKFDSVEMNCNLDDESFVFSLKKGKKSKDVVLDIQEINTLYDNEVDGEFVETIEKRFKAK
tara:strand:- start:266 stop:508 length:243 start_codon:yes stop_codon:yes gene_type:complete